MHGRNINFLMQILCLLLINCENFIEVKTIKKISSPNGNFNVIVQTVDGGTATEKIIKIFLLQKSLKINKHSTPIFTTRHDNIIDVFWKDESNIIIRILSESLIHYYVIKYYEFNIHVEIQKTITTQEPEVGMVE
jgi:hypothetical protein